jgi:hypothetical protein
MPRRARLDSPETLHHVIIRGIECNKIVDDDKDRKDFIDSLFKRESSLAVSRTWRAED